MYQAHIHHEHTLHFGGLHFDEWIAFIGTAALIAAFAIGVIGFDASALIVDPNLAP